MGATEAQLASFVRTFPTDDIPSEITHLAKRCLIAAQLRKQNETCRASYDKQ